ncbi:MAG: hypothetical protein LBR06_09040, partial [Bacteroidales bacterium]|nr:hypothetical protein [Bacteroidales bacterium]
MKKRIFSTVLITFARLTLIAGIFGSILNACSHEHTIDAPESAPVPFTVALTKSANPEDNIIDARLIITNTAG